VVLNNNIIPYIILIKKTHNILDFSYLPTRESKTKVYRKQTNKPKIRNTHEITLKIRIEFTDQS